MSNKCKNFKMFDVFRPDINLVHPIDMTSSVSTTSKLHKDFSTFQNIYNPNITTRNKNQVSLQHQIQQQQQMHHYSNQNCNFFNQNFAYSDPSKFNHPDISNGSFYTSLNEPVFNPQSTTNQGMQEKQSKLSTNDFQKIILADNSCIKEEVKQTYNVESPCTEMLAGLAPQASFAKEHSDVDAKNKVSTSEMKA